MIMPQRENKMGNGNERLGAALMSCVRVGEAFQTGRNPTKALRWEEGPSLSVKQPGVGGGWAVAFIVKEFGFYSE